MRDIQPPKPQRRIYPLDPRDLTEEQIAVAFAMTSRRPEPFDEIAKLVSEAKAANFHERWVLNYGHSSVAEHAIIHMAVENISRLACDTLEDNRLGSYTEKSSRYQIIDQNAFHTPKELLNTPLQNMYTSTCEYLFREYHIMVEELSTYLKQKMLKGKEEKDGSFKLRIRREAIDSCRFILPAATLTNVGVTMNARSLEHAILKLLSSEIIEEKEIGQEIKEQGLNITPTLIKYAENNKYLSDTRKLRNIPNSYSLNKNQNTNVSTKLIHFDPLGEDRVLAAIFYKRFPQPYELIWNQISNFTQTEKSILFDEIFGGLGPHDIPLRELENTDYLFDMVMDYGAYREYKRHRMQTYIPQPLTVDLGFVLPPLIKECGLGNRFLKAMQVVAETFQKINNHSPYLAEYLVTHAHNRRLLCKINLRECYHLLKLRTQPQAHFTIQEVGFKILNEIKKVHPLLSKYLQLRAE